MGTRVLALGVLFAALATSAAAASSGPLNVRSQRDGTFSVQAGRGIFQLQNVQGSVLGQVDRGKVTITSNAPAIVRGYQSIKIKPSGAALYCCKNLRFRIPRGKFTVQIDQGVGVQLSVVGRGRAMMLGAGYAELGLSDGTYQLNDSPDVPVPDVRTWVQIKAPQPGPPPKRSQLLRP